MNDRARDPRRVIDLSATRALKNATGQTIPQEYTPKFNKHADEAMAMGNPAPKKKSLLDKANDLLGLNDE